MPKGEFVFHEGEEGDAFYIVARGTAVARKRVLTADEAVPGGAVYDDEHEMLSELNQWDCFGERALLRDQVRYASVEATSHVLSLPLALVLFCVPSIALCPLLEAELARATLLLSDAERARASLLSVNISES